MSTTTEFDVDKAADAIVDAAMDLCVGPRGFREARREQFQDLIDALIDRCREYYSAKEVSHD
jgi:hypothetical protein